MSFMDSLKELAGQSTPQNDAAQVDHGAVAQALVHEADQHPGGLQGLLDQFRNNGLGGHVNSWTSPGPNQSIAPDQLQQGMGSDMIGNIAQRVGVSPGVAKAALVTVLPLLVSHLSQGGQSMPSRGGLAGLASGLFSRGL